jgi:hypothetical protein
VIFSKKKQSGTNAGNATVATLGPNGLAALAYARRGLRVFPLPASSKSPLAGSHGWREATCDEAQIRAWWTENPQYGIGIATGDGLVVLDIDSSERGKASLAKLVGLLGVLPSTVSVHTPGKGGGVHLYFKTSGRFLPNHVGVAVCVDIRGEDGYVVAPPSRHPDGGRYEFAEGLSFDEIKVAELPPNWADFLDLGGKSADTDYDPGMPKGGNSDTEIALPASGREVTISITIR